MAVLDPYKNPFGTTQSTPNTGLSAAQQANLIQNQQKWQSQGLAGTTPTSKGGQPTSGYGSNTGYTPPTYTPPKVGTGFGNTTPLNFKNTPTNAQPGMSQPGGLSPGMYNPATGQFVGVGMSDYQGPPGQGPPGNPGNSWDNYPGQSPGGTGQVTPNPDPYGHPEIDFIDANGNPHINPQYGQSGNNNSNNAPQQPGQPGAGPGLPRTGGMNGDRDPGMMPNDPTIQGPTSGEGPPYPGGQPGQQMPGQQGGWQPPTGPGNTGSNYMYDQNGNIQFIPGQFGNMPSLQAFLGMNPEQQAQFQNYYAMTLSGQQQSQAGYENQANRNQANQQFMAQLGLAAQGQGFEQQQQTLQWIETLRRNGMEEGFNVRDFTENVRQAQQSFELENKIKSGQLRLDQLTQSDRNKIEQGQLARQKLQDANNFQLGQRGLNIQETGQNQQFQLGTRAADLADRVQTGQLNIQALLANHTISNEEKQQVLAELTQRQNNATANRGLGIQEKGQNQQFQLGTRAADLADRIQTGQLSIQALLANNQISNADKAQALKELENKQQYGLQGRAQTLAEQMGQSQMGLAGRAQTLAETQNTQQFGLNQRQQNLAEMIGAGQLNIQQLLANHTISNEDKQQVLAELTQRQNNANKMQELFQTGQYQQGQLGLGFLQAGQQNTQFFQNLQQERLLEEMRLKQQERAANVAATGRAFAPNVNWLRAS